MRLYIITKHTDIFLRIALSGEKISESEIHSLAGWNKNSNGQIQHFQNVKYIRWDFILNAKDAPQTHRSSYGFLHRFECEVECKTQNVNLLVSIRLVVCFCFSFLTGKINFASFDRLNILQSGRRDNKKQGKASLARGGASTTIGTKVQQLKTAFFVCVFKSRNAKACLIQCRNHFLLQLVQ